ncbi:hypothetical protein DNK59_16710 [Pseudomonas sp. TKO26]|nr:hypothetical protein DNK62_16710 [Pseudomonas sp. TKO30]PYY86785.1 hypothetical protein DNK61_16705 [Pseudomonas sp. TKO29]PYY89428.1 hypothetical protein DNK59_16710 [Pseudomonas sp. TKO26]PYY99257.1 hypothetical protein DNK60_16700 [Pseudomonas sp. TKO14]
MVMQAGVEAGKIHGASCHAAQVPGKPGTHRRSRLAGEQGRKPCIALADAFAGKPVPTAGPWVTAAVAGSAGSARPPVWRTRRWSAGG